MLDSLTLDIDSVFISRRKCAQHGYDCGTSGRKYIVEGASFVGGGTRSDRSSKALVGRTLSITTAGEQRGNEFDYDRPRPMQQCVVNERCEKGILIIRRKTSAGLLVGAQCEYLPNRSIVAFVRARSTALMAKRNRCAKLANYQQIISKDYQQHHTLYKRAK